MADNQVLLPAPWRWEQGVVPQGPDDQSGDWWSGVFRLGAGVVVATALAVQASTVQAQRVSQQPQDEITKFIQVEEDAYQPPRPWALVVPRLVGLDVEWVPALTSVVDDDPGYVPLPPLGLSPPGPIWLVDASEALPWIADEDPGTQLRPTWDQVSVVPAAWTFDSGEFYANPIEEEWYRPGPMAFSANRVPVLWAGDSQEVVTAPPQIAHEEWWVNPVAPALWPTVLKQQSDGDQQERITAITPLPVEEDVWSAPVVAPLSTPRLYWQADSMELAASVALDDSGWVLPRPWPLPVWTGAASTAQSESAGLSVPAQVYKLTERSVAAYLLTGADRASFTLTDRSRP